MTSAALPQGVKEEAEVMLYTETLYFKQYMLLHIIAIYICAVWGADIYVTERLRKSWDREPFLCYMSDLIYL